MVTLTKLCFNNVEELETSLIKERLEYLAKKGIRSTVKLKPSTLTTWFKIPIVVTYVNGINRICVSQSPSAILRAITKDSIATANPIKSITYFIYHTDSFPKEDQLHNASPPNLSRKRNMCGIFENTNAMRERVAFDIIFEGGLISTVGLGGQPWLKKYMEENPDSFTLTLVKP